MTTMVQMGSFGARTPVRPLGEADTRRKFLDPLTDEVVLRASLPDAWQPTTIELDGDQAYGSWPFTLFFEAQDGQGSIIRYRTPREWVASDPNQLAMAQQMGMPMQPNERSCMDPASYLDSLVAEQVGPAAGLRSVGERDWPVAPAKRVSDEQATQQVRTMREQAIAQMNQTNAQACVTLDDARVHSLCRLYAFEWEGTDYRLALFATVQAVTITMRQQMPGSQQPSMVDSGTSFASGQARGGTPQAGGLFSRTLGSQGAVAQAGRKLQDAMFGRHTDQGWLQRRTGTGQAAGQQTPSPGMAQAPTMSLTSTEWGDLSLYALIAPSSSFEKLYAGTFTDFCGSATIDASLVALKDRLGLAKMQEQQAEFARMQQGMANPQAAWNHGSQGQGSHPQPFGQPSQQGASPWQTPQAAQAQGAWQQGGWSQQGPQQGWPQASQQPPQQAWSPQGWPKQQAPAFSQQGPQQAWPQQQAQAFSQQQPAWPTSPQPQQPAQGFSSGFGGQQPAQTGEQGSWGDLLS